MITAHSRAVKRLINAQTGKKHFWRRRWRGQVVLEFNWSGGQVDTFVYLQVSVVAQHSLWNRFGYHGIDICLFYIIVVNLFYTSRSRYEIGVRYVFIVVDNVKSDASFLWFISIYFKDFIIAILRKKSFPFGLPVPVLRSRTQLHECINIYHEGS